MNVSPNLSDCLMITANWTMNRNYNDLRMLILIAVKVKYYLLCVCSYFRSFHCFYRVTVWSLAFFNYSSKKKNRISSIHVGKRTMWELFHSFVDKFWLMSTPIYHDDLMQLIPFASYFLMELGPVWVVGRGEYAVFDAVSTVSLMILQIYLTVWTFIWVVFVVLGEL